MLGTTAHPDVRGHPRRLGQRGPSCSSRSTCPFEPEAAALAVDAAVESGQPLIVVNVVEIADRADLARDGVRVRRHAGRRGSLCGRRPSSPHSLAVDVERLRLVQPAPARGPARARRRARARAARRRPGPRADEAAARTRGGRSGSVSAPPASSGCPPSSASAPLPASPARVESSAACRSSDRHGCARRRRVEARRRPLDAEDPGELPRLSRTGAAIGGEALLALLAAVGEARARTRSSSATSAARVVIVRAVYARERLGRQLDVAEREHHLAGRGRVADARPAELGHALHDARSCGRSRR